MVDFDRLYPDDKDRPEGMFDGKTSCEPRREILSDCDLLKEIRKRWKDSTLLKLEECRLLETIGEKKIKKWLKERKIRRSK